MLKHCVEFLEPGVFFAESEVREAKDRIPANLTKIPKYTYAISFYDVEIIVKDGETLKGKNKNESQRIVFGEKVHWKKIEDTPEKRRLRRNLENNGYRGYGVKCITNNWQPFLKDDILLHKHSDLKTLTEAI